MTEQQEAQALDLASDLYVSHFGTFSMTQTKDGANIRCEEFQTSPREGVEWSPEDIESEVLHKACRVAITYHVACILMESIRKTVGHGSDIVTAIREGESSVVIRRDDDT